MTQPKFPEIEEQILKYWEENKAFHIVRKLKTATTISLA